MEMEANNPPIEVGEEPTNPVGKCLLLCSDIYIKAIFKKYNKAYYIVYKHRFLLTKSYISVN